MKILEAVVGTVYNFPFFPKLCLMLEKLVRVQKAAVVVEIILTYCIELARIKSP